MRFLLASARGKWFRSMHTAAILGYFLAFGLMGLWHGIEPHYILYGLYMATLLSAFHIFSSWKKVHRPTARRPALECARRFYHFQRGLLRSANFLGASGAAPIVEKTARETFDAEGCSLTLRIYRKMLVLKTLGHGFGLLRLDLFGRGIQ